MKPDSLTQTLRGVLLGLLVLTASLLFSGAAALAWFVNRLHAGSGTLTFVAAVGLGLFGLRPVLGLGLRLYRVNGGGINRSRLRQALERHPQRAIQIHAVRNDLDGALALIDPQAEALLTACAQTACTAAACWRAPELGPMWLLHKQWDTVRAMAELYGQHRPPTRLLTLALQCARGWQWGAAMPESFAGVEATLVQARRYLSGANAGLHITQVDHALNAAFVTLRTGYMAHLLCRGADPTDHSQWASQSAQRAAARLEQVARACWEPTAAPASAPQEPAGTGTAQTPSEAPSESTSEAQPAGHLDPALESGALTGPGLSGATDVPSTAAQAAPTRTAVAPSAPQAPRTRPALPRRTQVKRRTEAPEAPPEQPFSPSDIPPWLRVDGALDSATADVSAPSTGAEVEPTIQARSTPKRTAAPSGSDDVNIHQGQLF